MTEAKFFFLLIGPTFLFYIKKGWLFYMRCLSLSKKKKIGIFILDTLTIMTVYFYKNVSNLFKKSVFAIWLGYPLLNYNLSTVYTIRTQWVTVKPISICRIFIAGFHWELARFPHVSAFSAFPGSIYIFTARCQLCYQQLQTPL